MSLTRRRFLTNSVSAALGVQFAAEITSAASRPSFTFVYITDAHIQPELDAAQGVHKAFAAVDALPEKPAFALIGGDLVMDATSVPRARADLVYDLWQQEAAALHLPLHYAMGNHDLYDLKDHSSTARNDPEFGKGMWKKRLNLDRTFTTFDHQGWRFIVLDSIGVTPDQKWEGNLDDAQLQWLDGILRNTPHTMPVICLTHFPIFTLYGQYTEGTTSALGPDMIVKNGKVFKEIIQRHNVKVVLQGHTHVVEECIYLGTRYITGGAICGNWWMGPRLGVHPEGFVVATVRGDDFAWRYEPYGWKTRFHPS
jgi:3',5'-cyclic AMP phosphodiesterase CpdA